MNRKPTAPKETEIRIFATPGIPGLVKLWVLRALVRLNGKNKLITEEGFSNDDLARAIGFKRWLFPSEKEYDRLEVTKYLYKLYITTEKRCAKSKPPIRIHRNLNRLAEELNLSEIEVRILTFAVLIKIYNILEEILDLFGSVNSTGFYHGLSVILDIKIDLIKKSTDTERNINPVRAYVGYE